MIGLSKRNQRYVFVLFLLVFLAILAWNKAHVWLYWRDIPGKIAYIDLSGKINYRLRNSANLLKLEKEATDPLALAFSPSGNKLMFVASTKNNSGKPGRVLSVYDFNKKNYQSLGTSDLWQWLDDDSVIGYDYDRYFDLRKKAWVAFAPGIGSVEKVFEANSKGKILVIGKSKGQVSLYVGSATRLQRVRRLDEVLLHNVSFWDGNDTLAFFLPDNVLPGKKVLLTLNIFSGRLTQMKLPIVKPIESVEFSPDGSKLLLTSSTADEDVELSLLNLKTRRHKLLVKHRDIRITFVSWLPDSRHFLIAMPHDWQRPFGQSLWLGDINRKPSLERRLAWGIEEVDWSAR